MAGEAFMVSTLEWQQLVNERDALVKSCKEEWEKNQRLTARLERVTEALRSARCLLSPWAATDTKQWIDQVLAEKATDV